MNHKSPSQFAQMFGQAPLIKCGDIVETEIPYLTQQLSRAQSLHSMQLVNSQFGIEKVRTRIQAEIDVALMSVMQEKYGVVPNFRVLADPVKGEDAEGKPVLQTAVEIMPDLRGAIVCSGEAGIAGRFILPGRVDLTVISDCIAVTGLYCWSEVQEEFSVELGTEMKKRYLDLNVSALLYPVRYTSDTLRQTGAIVVIVPEEV